MLNHGYVRGYVDGADEKILDGTSTHRRPTGAPRGRQVADRARREGLRDGPLRWRAPPRSRGADGAGDAPPRAPADRLDPARLPGRAAAGTSHGVHLVPAGPAPDSLALFRSAAWPAWSTGLGAGPRAAAPSAAAGGRSALLVSLAAHRRRWGLALGTKWTAPAFPLAAFGIPGLARSAGARRSAGVRRARLRSAVVDGLPAFVHLVGVAAVCSTSRLGWVAGQRRGLRGVALLDAVHALRGRGAASTARPATRRRRTVVADRVRARRQRPGRDRAVVALALVLPPGRLHLSTPTT